MSYIGHDCPETGNRMKRYCGRCNSGDANAVCPDTTGQFVAALARAFAPDGPAHGWRLADEPLAIKG